MQVSSKYFRITKISKTPGSFYLFIRFKIFDIDLSKIVDISDEQAFEHLTHLRLAKFMQWSKAHPVPAERATP